MTTPTTHRYIRLIESLIIAARGSIIPLTPNHATLANLSRRSPPAVRRCAATNLHVNTARRIRLISSRRATLSKYFYASSASRRILNALGRVGGYDWFNSGAMMFSPLSIIVLFILYATNCGEIKVFNMLAGFDVSTWRYHANKSDRC